ncbi:MAG: hypothetical protein ABSB01_16700 [Streptosporangiaceae bacterium]
MPAAKVCWVSSDGQVGADRAGVMEIAAETARLAGVPDRGLPLVEAAVGSPHEAADQVRIAPDLFSSGRAQRPGGGLR